MTELQMQSNELPSIIKSIEELKRENEEINMRLKRRNFEQKTIETEVSNENENLKSQSVSLTESRRYLEVVNKKVQITSLTISELRQTMQLRMSTQSPATTKITEKDNEMFDDAFRY